MQSSSNARRTFLLAFVAFALMAGQSAMGADPLAKLAITNIDEVDGDYAFQGEYYGTLAYVGGGPRMPFGLQVAAEGNGDYIAIEYPGGLPGLGWYGGRESRLRGRREPDRLTLRGEGRRYDIAENLAWYMDENGDKLTWLTKVDRRSRTLGEPAPEPGDVCLAGSRPMNSPTCT